jgi:nucleotide-binding universal stress UspA family protein
MNAPIDHILVPTDFSEHSQHALVYAASLGERYGATIHLVHAMTLEDTGDTDRATQFPDLQPFLDRADQAARQKLDAGVDHGGMAEATVVQKVVQSVNPHEGIITYASEHGIDLIVIALKGKSPLSYMVMGSVTERVIRYAPCPVLVVEEGDRDFVDPASGRVQLRKMAVAHDLGDQSQAAMAYAVQKLLPYAPEVHVIHAVESQVPSAYVAAGVTKAFKVNPQMKETLSGLMVDRADQAVPADWTTEAHVVEGKPHLVVTAEAERLEADLLVVGRESNRSLSERLVGGTSERMVRHAPCPTLIA